MSEKLKQELDAASKRVSGYSREQRAELEAHARNKAFEMVESADVKVTTVRLTGSKQQQKRTLRDLKKWKKVSKSDQGEPSPVCNCMDGWRNENNVCPVHG